ncbi:hypothetical protein D4765_08610 [Subtercola vilae]|uniref:Uncharacterized protein n=1 Tax=Subtercola vilae TaxID=2056433 RepID=A0A4T2BYY6_9MICO|nr:hypothetical protein D4765_08610 [Subtercola vilae]
MCFVLVCGSFVGGVVLVALSFSVFHLFYIAPFFILAGTSFWSISNLENPIYLTNGELSERKEQEAE